MGKLPVIELVCVPQLLWPHSIFVTAGPVTVSL